MIIYNGFNLGIFRKFWVIFWEDSSATPPPLKTNSLPLKINGWLEDVFPDGSIVPFEGTFVRFPGAYLSKGEKVGFAGFA